MQNKEEKEKKSRKTICMGTRFVKEEVREDQQQDIR